MKKKTESVITITKAKKKVLANDHSNLKDDHTDLKKRVEKLEE